MLGNDHTFQIEITLTKGEVLNILDELPTTDAIDVITEYLSSNDDALKLLKKETEDWEELW